MKSSIIMTMNKDKLQSLLNESSSFSEVMIKLGYTNIEGNMRTLKKRIEIDKLNTCILENNRSEKRSQNAPFNKEISIEKVFKENSNYSRTCIRRIIIKKSLLEYKCNKCNNTGNWENSTLTLELEHKNGINNDNRLENLCFLCPNCHSQTITYAGKNNSTNIQMTMGKCKCGNNIGKYNKSGFCFSCAMKNKITERKFEIPKEKMEELISTMPISKIAKEYNVSDQAIRKRVIKYGMKHLLKPRGYWVSQGDLL